MNNVYFVQIAVSHYKHTIYLPYASGCLITYALQDDKISSAYNFRDILFMREEIDIAMQRLHDPFLVAFSCSVGNMAYSKTFAEKIKSKYPSCLIVFGGHGIDDGVAFLKENNSIDFTVFGEGEHAFAELLISLQAGTGYDKIDNLAYRTPQGIVRNNTFQNFDIGSYPSPYLNGIFDNMFSKYPGIEFHAIIETNRGCPYHCAFCEWCFTESIRYFPLERVKQEIEWMSAKHIEYCYCADANFGIAPRDIEIAKFVVETRKKTDYPTVFRPTYAKNSNDTVFEAGRILNLNHADKGVTIAYQSLNKTTLELIGRREMDMRAFSELQQKYAAEGIPSYTEIILGLPGETYESFCNGLCLLLEAGQHNSLAVYQCQIYTNALMGNKAYQKKHGIKTAKVPINSAHFVADFNGIPEYYDVVIETADMSADEWVNANMFSVVLQAFHNMGLLRCFAVYLHYEKQTEYYTFYSRLLSFISNANGTYMQKLFFDIRNRFYDTDTGVWAYKNEKFGDIGWYFEEAFFLEMAYANEQFWKEIAPFIKQLDIEGSLLQELLKFQKLIIRRPGIDNASAELSYDFYHYFEQIYRGEYLPLEEHRCRIKISSKIHVSSWEEYAPKIVLGGKRRGETIFTNEKNCIVVDDV